MKNKFTKLFVILVALFSKHSMSAQEMHNEMPGYVKEKTNIEFLQEFSKKTALESELNLKEAIAVAEKKGKPISGEKEGRFFSLVGYDKENDLLIYRTTFNNIATGSSLQTANAKVMHNSGVTGVGLNVGVWDGGVLPISHQGFMTAGVNRYTVKDSGNNFLGNKVSGREHAAHVAGTVASGSFGNGETMGFAYGAKVFAYNWDFDTSEMAAAAANVATPMYVSNHSYGLDLDEYFEAGGSTSIFGLYNSRARAYDIIANNAPYYTIVIAAGNDRDGSYNKAKISGKDLLTEGCVSKNTVVVAATKGTEDFSGISGVSSVSGSNSFIAYFSNYGPTNDFRIKPDIAAKGVNVKSLAITNSTATAINSGTSMAAPAVTGVFALWQDYHNQTKDRFMLSASIRALMAHTAKEAGPAPGPDFMFGWGLIDAGKGKEIIDGSLDRTVLFEELNLPQNATFNYEFDYDGVEDLVATIAWNDPAGTADSNGDVNLKKLINDLDLTLIRLDDNKVFYPWSLRKNWSVSPTSNTIADNTVRNDRDNIEKIELFGQNKVAGRYKVVVNHTGNLSGGEQNFSIIISGAGSIMPIPEPASTNMFKNLDVSIYPNPVDSVLNIKMNEDIMNNVDFEIIDISGRIVSNPTILEYAHNNFKLDVSSLKSGVYLLKATSQNKQAIQKFVKK